MSKRPRRRSSSPTQDPDQSPSTPPPETYGPITKFTRSSHSPPPPKSPSPSTPQKPTSTSTSSTSTTSINCTLPSCPHRDHPTTTSYESHYLTHHTNRCHTCTKNFPSPRILDCHIRENHDPLSLVKKERGGCIYGCFVEDCERLFYTAKLRNEHLVDGHYYPRDWRWGIVDRGVDGVRSLLVTPERMGGRRTRTRVVVDSGGAVGAKEGDVEMEGGKEAEKEVKEKSKAAKKKQRAKGKKAAAVKEKGDGEDDEMEVDDGAGEKEPAEKNGDIDMFGETEGTSKAAGKKSGYWQKIKERKKEKDAATKVDHKNDNGQDSVNTNEPNGHDSVEKNGDIDMLEDKEPISPQKPNPKKKPHQKPQDKPHKQPPKVPNQGSSKVSEDNIAPDVSNGDAASKNTATTSKPNTKPPMPPTTVATTSAASTNDDDIDMADITSRMSNIKFIPPSVRFGRRGGGAGFARK